MYITDIRLTVSYLTSLLYYTIVYFVLINKSTASYGLNLSYIHKVVIPHQAIHYCSVPHIYIIFTIFSYTTNLITLPIYITSYLISIESMSKSGLIHSTVRCITSSSLPFFNIEWESFSRSFSLFTNSR